MSGVHGRSVFCEGDHGQNRQVRSHSQPASRGGVVVRLDEGEYLAHYGILRKSGRYPWGSGNTPLQRSKTFLDITNDLRKEGMSDAQIAKAFSPVDEAGNVIKDYQLTTADIRGLRSRA